MKQERVQNPKSRSPASRLGAHIHYEEEKDEPAR